MLDPILVKALIASESSFKVSAWNRKKGRGRARGLMQVTDGTFRLLAYPSKELSDHFVNLTEKDALDPVLDICAGVRWLFRKRQIAASKMKVPITWIDAVKEYKGIDSPRKMSDFQKFDEYFRSMKNAH